VSLSPGTRIPEGAKGMLAGLMAGGAIKSMLETHRVRQAYYRGLVEGGVLGIIAGSLVTACCLALAWSHWG